MLSAFTRNGVGLLLGALLAGAGGCELIATVDRSLIPGATPGGQGGGGGGQGGDGQGGRGQGGAGGAGQGGMGQGGAGQGGMGQGGMGQGGMGQGGAGGAGQGGMGQGGMGQGGAGGAGGDMGQGGSMVQVGVGQGGAGGDMGQGGGGQGGAGGMAETACAAQELACGGQCVDPTSSASHCGGCDDACGASEACVGAVCVGSGSLQFSATWSRPGDADLHVTTPAGNTISWTNVGPSAGTDAGQMDLDDVAGQGPENIFWSTDSAPPSGVYHVCVQASGFDPAPSAAAPVSYTVTVRRPAQAPQTFSGTLTGAALSGACNPGQPGYVTSITNP